MALFIFLPGSARARLIPPDFTFLSYKRVGCCRLLPTGSATLILIMPGGTCFIMTQTGTGELLGKLFFATALYLIHFFMALHPNMSENSADISFHVIEHHLKHIKRFAFVFLLGIFLSIAAQMYTTT